MSVPSAVGTGECGRLDEPFAGGRAGSYAEGGAEGGGSGSADTGIQLRDERVCEDDEVSVGAGGELCAEQCGPNAMQAFGSCAKSWKDWRWAPDFSAFTQPDPNATLIGRHRGDCARGGQ